MLGLSQSLVAPPKSTAGSAVPGHRAARTRLAPGFVLLLLLTAALPVPVRADALNVPNASFESPQTPFADPRMDEWQKAPEPPWYMGGGGFPWEQLMGQFLNAPDGDTTNHIDNMDGAQAAFLFA